MSDEIQSDAPDALAQVEARREARKTAASKAAREQLAVDLEAIDAIEQRLGDTNVAVVRVGYTPGLPAAAAVRCPVPKEIKAFRDKVKPQKDGRNRDVEPDKVAAAELLASWCVVYPDDKSAYEALCAARPGLAAQLGAEAVKLAVGAEESEGKG